MFFLKLILYLYSILHSVFAIMHLKNLPKMEAEAIVYSQRCGIIPKTCQYSNFHEMKMHVSICGNAMYINVDNRFKLERKLV